jgi:hypothetical protein
MRQGWDFPLEWFFGTERKKKRTKPKNSASGIMHRAVESLRGDFLFSESKQESV